MSSLTSCIKKSGKDLHKEDKAAILQKARDYRTAGDSPQVSASKAISEQITGLQATIEKHKSFAASNKKEKFSIETLALNTFSTLSKSILAEILKVSKTQTIEKEKMFTVTMDFEELLSKFFGVYGSDAEVLAQLLGFEKEGKEKPEDDNYWENYIKERVDKFSVIEKAYTEKTPNLLKQVPAEQLYKLEKAVNDYDEYITKLTDKVGSLKAVEKSAGKNLSIPILKSADELKKEITFVVYEPDTEDAHGNWTDKAALAEGCTLFNKALEEGKAFANLFHTKDADGKYISTDTFTIFKSYICEDDCYIGEQFVKEGTWLAKVRILNDTLWDMFIEKKVRGLSVGCKGYVGEEE